MNFSNEECAILLQNAHFFEVPIKDALIIIEIVDNTTTPEQTFKEKLQKFITLCVSFKLENPSFMDIFHKYKKELF